MCKLKVLIVTNYNHFGSTLHNFEVLSSLTNLKKIRLEGVAIPFLATTNLRWDNVQKLSLVRGAISQTFILVKISKVFPNLLELNIEGEPRNLLLRFMKSRLPAGLSYLINLKKLSITDYILRRLPEGIGKLVNLEVLRLTFCRELEKLPDSICKLSKLTLLDISFCISIKNLPEHIGELCSLKKLNMKGCLNLQMLPQSFLDFEQLKDVVCDEELKEQCKLYLPYANIRTTRNIF